MASEMTGSALPMRAAHPDAAPPLSRSKRGMSIAGIPSLRGPPDLISSRGTVCCEKSVRGHSARQLNDSAVALPTAIAARAPTAATISTAVRMQFPNLNGSPLRISILSQRLQIAISVDFDLIIRSTAQQGYGCASLFLLPRSGCPVVSMADAVGQARFILRKRRIGFLFERYSCCAASPH